MQRHRAVTVERLEKFAHPIYWRDVNLRGNHYPRKTPLVSLQAYAVPHLARIPFAEAVRGEFVDARVGQSWGPTWATVWFRLEAHVPDEWRGDEVHLLWDAGCEALVYSADGAPLQGLCGGGGDDRRAEYVLARPARGGERVTLYVEMACNEMFGAGDGMMIAPPNPNRHFTLGEAAIGAFDREKWELYVDFTIIADMAKHLPQTSARSGQALWTANAMVNTIDILDRKTWAHARDLANKFLSSRTAESEHTVSAIGHCHIDTAWLWPYAETIRKCARSWASQIHYMSLYPDYVFAASQAQQYAWVKERYPALWTSLKSKVTEGRFVPTGGTWVEMTRDVHVLHDDDCNLPSGESLVRQFLYGQRFFEAEFGKRCTEFWLPDTFGYSAQLPQIVRSAGIEFFLTQKLSWNMFNKPTMHTFLWEGLDGTRLFTHFPPADTYNADAKVEDVLKAATNYHDRDRSRHSMTLYGRGDGGGGPLPEHIQRLARMRDVAGLPRVQMQTPRAAFEALRAEIKDPLVWVGELYFELHRGTYTTHAAAKKGNRQGEHALREAEIWNAVAALTHRDHKYPKEELDRLWRLLLLNQFHDVLPGSSIGAVYDDCAAHHADILRSASALTHSATAALLPSGGAFNSLAFERTEVVELDAARFLSLSLPKPLQTSLSGHALYLQSAPSLGFCSLSPVAAPADTVHVRETAEGVVLENNTLRALVARDGLVRSLVHKPSGREAVAAGEGANQFVMFDDVPFYWDAWDTEVYSLEKARLLPPAASVAVVESGPLRGTVRVTHASPPITCLVSLSAHSRRLDFSAEVEWREAHKFLKVQFPVRVRASEAAYEVQYGHVRRPTHRNTSWDLARFEVCAHRWMDLAEHGFGVALLNDSKYGHSALGSLMRLSLLRSPKNPDPRADMGAHRVHYALMPHAGAFQDAGVPDEAAALNAPLFLLAPLPAAPSARPVPPNSLFSLPHCGVVLDAVKRAEDGSGDLILRLYESWGGTATFTIATPFAVERVASCSVLEEPDGAYMHGETRRAIGPLTMAPFKILTLRVRLSNTK